MTHAGGRLGCQQVAGRDLEELQYRLILEGRRIRHVDYHLRAGQRGGQALARQRVDSGVRRGRQDLLAALAQ
jgi:hypothetical protein